MNLLINNIVLFDIADNDIEDNRKTKTYILIGKWNKEYAYFTKIIYKNRIHNINEILKGTISVTVRKKEWLKKLNLVKYLYLQLITKLK